MVRLRGAIFECFRAVFAVAFDPSVRALAGNAELGCDVSDGPALGP